MSPSDFNRGKFFQKLHAFEDAAANAMRQSLVSPRVASRGLVGTLAGGVGRVRRVQDALAQSQAIALANLTRKLGAIELDVVWPILKEVLHDMALYFGGSVLAGSVIGAGIGFFGMGVGAIPGAAAGASLGAEVGSAILTFLGLKSIIGFMMESIPEVVHSYKEGFKAAWGEDPASRSHQFDAAQAGPTFHTMSGGVAARAFARGHEILMIALLAGFVAYLTRGKGKLADLLSEVRHSARLGPRVAAWLEKNSGKLVANPSLRQKVFGAGGGAARTGEKAVGKGAASKAEAAVAKHPPPPPAPPARGGVIDQVKKKAKSLRSQYMGRTPGKKSRTGRQVIERMRREGKIKTNAKGEEIFLASDKQWYPLSTADMAHKKPDAVIWWNEKGKFYPRPGDRPAPEVREWMLDANNYELDHYSINRSAGAKLDATYDPHVPEGPD